MKQELIGRRYARALIESISDQTKWPLILQELSDLNVLLQTPSNDLARLFDFPAFRNEERKQVLETLAQILHFQEQTHRFLQLLIDSGRIRCLDAILNAFREELDLRLLQARATLTTADPLSPDQEQSLARDLSKRLGKTVIASSKIDKAVQGGIRAQIGGLIFDSTVQGQLDRLKKELQESYF